MNAEALRLTGFENVEQVRRNLRAWPEYELRALDGEVIPVDEWPLGRVTRGESFVDYEIRVLNRKTGEDCIWSYSGGPVFENGDLVRAVLTFRDVTQERSAQEMLRESERRLRSVLEDSLDASYRRDLQTGVYDYLSPMIESITGLTPEEFANLSLENVFERIHPSDVAAVQDALSSALETGQLTVEYRLRKKDDSYVWLADNAKVVKDSHGEPKYLSGVIRDITKRTELQKQAEVEHQRLRTLLDALPIAVFISDAEGGLIYTNEQATGVWGELPATPSADEYGLYKAWWPHTGERLKPEDWSGARALTGETVLGEVLEIERFDGNHSTILNSSVPIRDDQGAITGQVTVEQDITERVRIEEQLREALEAQREAGRYSEALNQVDAEVASVLDVQQIMQLVLDRTARTVGADVGAVYVPAEGEWKACYTWQAPAWLEGIVVRAQDIPYSMEAARERRAMLFLEPAEHSGWRESVAGRLNARQVLDAPLMLGADEAGYVTLYKLERGDFTEADRDFLQKASAAVSLAIQNARRYERERDIADTLQEALLTLPAGMPGVAFAHAYHSAAEAARVGGDFYDIFPIGDDLVGIIVGDVAGKGLGASALTSLVKNAIRAHATEKGASPGKILELTSDMVFNSTTPESFVTVFFGVLDCRDGRLAYASAGHTTGAMVSTDGTVIGLSATGPVLGAFSGMSFDQREACLELCESLFLYTDGLTEARRGEELFGETRLFDLLGRFGDGGPASTIRSVIEEVLRFAGGRLNDDLAILDVMRVESGESPSPEKVEM